MGLPQRLFVSAPATAAPKGAKQGDTLRGWLLLEDDLPRTLLKLGRSYANGEGGALVGRHPQGLAVTLLLQGGGSSAGAGAAGSSKPSSPKPEAGKELSLALFDAALARLVALDPLASGTPAAEKEKEAAAGEAASASASASAPASVSPSSTQGVFGATLPSLAAQSSHARNAFWTLHEALCASALPSPAATLALHAATLSALDDACVVKPWGAEAPLPAFPDPAPTQEAAARVRSVCDAPALAAWYGLRHEGEKDTPTSTGNAQAKAALIDALWRSARSLCAATWEAVAAGSRLTSAGAAPRPMRPRTTALAAPAAEACAAGCAAAGAALALALPPPAPRPPAAGAAPCEAAVAALNSWAPTTAPTKEAADKGEGGMGQLLACEGALRAGNWALALEQVRAALRAKAAGVVGAPGTLGSLPHRALLDLSVYCLVRLGEGFHFYAGKLAGEVAPILCGQA